MGTKNKRKFKKRIYEISGTNKIFSERYRRYFVGLVLVGSNQNCGLLQFKLFIIITKRQLKFHRNFDLSVGRLLHEMLLF